MTMFVTKSSHGLVSLLNDDSDVPAQPPTHNASNMTGETKQQGALSSGLSNRQCLICARIFSTSGHLTRHSTVHTHEQKYGCPFPNCHKRCSRMDNLTQHYRAHVGHPSKMSNSVVRHRMDIMRAEQQDVDMVEREPDDSNVRRPGAAYTLRGASTSRIPQSLSSSAKMSPSEGELPRGRSVSPSPGESQTMPWRPTTYRVPSTTDISLASQQSPTLSSASSSSSLQMSSTPHARDHPLGDLRRDRYRVDVDPILSVMKPQTNVLPALKAPTWHDPAEPFYANVETSPSRFSLSYARAE